MQVLTLNSQAVFKGFVRNGLDSSTMINLIICFDSKFEEFRKRGFTFPPNLFYYHEISRPEVIGVLINKYGFAKEEAKASFEELISQFNLMRINRNERQDEAYEQVVEKANESVVMRERKEKLKIGTQDIIIIAGFLREQINFIHSGDEGFWKTCEELKLNVVPMPKRDFDKEKEFKNFMKRS